MSDGRDIVPPADIDPDAAIMLQDAATSRLFPGGGMTVRTLRAERDRGRLETWMIGKREYTSLAALRRMIELCRVAQKERIARRRPPATDDKTDAEAALILARESAQRLKQMGRDSQQAAGASSAALASIDRLEKRVAEKKAIKRAERKARREQERRSSNIAARGRVRETT